MLSLCITTYNRYEETIRAFSSVIEDERISEVVIVDDYSDEDIYDKLLNDPLIEHPKVRLYRNSSNLGMSRNKLKSVSLANREWCIVFDSDNILDTRYIDAVANSAPLKDSSKLSKVNLILCPEFAFPNFDYRAYSNMVIGLDTASHLLDKGDSIFECLLNTCNYVVPRNEYIETWNDYPHVLGTDTINFNRDWLFANKFFYIVPGMVYTHTVHKDSGFLKDAAQNFEDAKKVKSQIIAKSK